MKHIGRDSTNTATQLQINRISISSLNTSPLKHNQQSFQAQENISTATSLEDCNESFDTKSQFIAEKRHINRSSQMDEEQLGDVQTLKHQNNKVSITQDKYWIQSNDKENIDPIEYAGHRMYGSSKQSRQALKDITLKMYKQNYGEVLARTLNLILRGKENEKELKEKAHNKLFSKCIRV